MQGDLPTALYPGNHNWNDWVEDDGLNRLNATGSACGGGTAPCFHSGIMRSVNVPVNSCDGLAGVDSLGALSWSCDDSTAARGYVRLISGDFQPAKGLSDLIDFESRSWKNVYMSAYSRCGDLILSTPTTAWWSNQVVDLADSPGPSTAGRIELISTTNTGGYTFTQNKVALLIKPGVSLSNAGGDIIAGFGFNFIHIEGNLSASTNVSAVHLNNSNYVRLNNIYAFDTSGSTAGFFIDGGHNIIASNLSAVNFGTDGMELYAISRSRFDNIAAVNNGVAGIFIHSTSANNMFQDILSANNTVGLELSATGANNSNIFLNHTITNNSTHGYLVNSNHLHTSYINILMVNNNKGIQTSSDQQSLVNIIAVNNPAGNLELSTSDDNYFTGVLKTGVSGCPAVTGTRPGIDINCTPTNASNASSTTNLDLSAAFIGAVNFDEPVNTSDNLGQALYSNSLDWHNFDNGASNRFLRHWGLDGAFPGSMGECATAMTCRIWDWSLLHDFSSPGQGGGGLNANAPPASGDDYQIHIWEAASAGACADIKGATWGVHTACSRPGYFDSASCTGAGGTWSANICVSLYLKNSVEIAGDLQGNDNGLCESNETCFYTPNIGAYQGHGSPVASPYIVSDGKLTGITLKSYQFNGY